MSNVENTNPLGRFAGSINEEQTKKLRQSKALPDGVWVAVGIDPRVSVKDAKSGKYGINAKFIPLPSPTADMKEGKRKYTMFNTFWSWLRDPSNKARKPGDTFGLFDGWVNAAEPTMPSDGSALPPRAKRDPESDMLTDEAGVALGKNMAEAKKVADAMQSKRDLWIQKLYIEFLTAAEDKKKSKDHPMGGYSCYGKVTHSKSPDGRVFANIGSFRKELPEGAELFNLASLKNMEDGEESEEQDEDEDDDGE
jgi:hypothetical protein